MNRLKPTPMRFDDLPDAAMIQIRPLIDFKVVPYVDADPILTPRGCC
jgi:hypothetical protein